MGTISGILKEGKSGIKFGENDGVRPNDTKIIDRQTYF